LYIARLLLKGFKSFGDSCELPLDPGMTAIVGPNGSGKSNLLDAMRWVLGDSHASKLRIAKQDGLIFHGSASRPPADEAEVSMQLRDGSRVCTMRRRVSENGAVSTVDGLRVTLAELDEAKRLWQLSGDRFAFIGQGDVAEVIQQRPGARRVLLESLFGIDAYRKRRTEASDRLKEAGEEYGRLRTFSAELASRREEIAPMAARAAAAREILDALESDRRLLYWVRRARNEAAMLEIDAEKRRMADILKLREAWTQRWERCAEVISGDIAELSRSTQGYARALEEAKSSLANFTRTAYGYGASLTSAKRRLARITDERSALRERLESLTSDRTRLENEGASIKSELSAAKKSLDEASERYRGQQEAMERSREKQELKNRERGELDGEIATLKGRMKSVGLSLRKLNETGGESSNDDPVKAIKKELDSLEKRHAGLLNAQADAASAHRDVYARLQEVSGELQRYRRESSKLASRLSELQEQAQTEVYPRPVQHILSAAKLGRINARPRAVLDVFTCPTELASAMEAFLGGRQFWILVETMDEAGTCIEILKKNQMGRATFLPLERSHPRRADNAHRLPPNGVVGWAMKLIESDAHWRPALEHLMGDLLIVENYATGQSLVRSGLKVPIATLEGDVFQPAGTISGGRAQKQGRAIEIKAALAKLEAEAEAARKLAESTSEKFSKLEEDEARAASEKDSASTEIRELASRRSALDATREEILRERARAKNERDSMIGTLKEGARSYAELTRRRRAMNAEGEEDAAGVDTELFKEIERLRSGVALAEERSRSGFVLSERVMAELKSAEADNAELDEEASRCDLEIMTNRANLTRLGRRYSEVAAEKRAALVGMAEFGERYENMSRRRDRRAARLESAKNASQAASSGLSSCDIRTAELARTGAELAATWEEQYPYPGAGAFPDSDPEELRRSIRDRDKNLKSLGEVDMGALSEDRNLKERLSYLGDQLDDVGNSMAELERLIHDADEQARVIFTDALEEIDKKFNDLFQTLFIGGDARLEMIEGDTLWESGVDVVARPPGKHPASIAQLSGGEQSLSAIALLFASLEVAKCPIAVLDEVDAALDEVNLRRFADLARDASRERQIFVMTHRRVTMERADVLYGVTLAEPGLSRVIGVKVEDWA
jgi:chromosome segregation protein